MATILFIGCGDVGLRLAKNILCLGHDVTIIKRTPLDLRDATVIN